MMPPELTLPLLFVAFFIAACVEAWRRGEFW